MPIQKITPFLWFDHQAEEAADFYASIFPNSKIVKVVRYGEAGPGPAGSAMTVEFQLEGQSFVALNGGPHFKFTEAISFVVNCQTQDEVDVYWEKLSAGGARFNAAGSKTNSACRGKSFRPYCRIVERSRSGKIATCHEGNDDDEKTRHSCAQAGF